MAEEVVGIRLALRDRASTQRGVEEVASGVEDIGDAAERSTKKSRGLLDVLGRLGSGAARAVKVGAAGLTALGAAGVVAGVRVASANEQATISFTTMLGSAQRAQSFIADLADFAKRTPFDFPGLQKSASSLISAGIGAEKVIPIMTTLGDVTAGMGTGAEGISRATVALQQMIAAQKISAEDLNQLRDAGVPVYDLLSAAMGKSVAEVSALRDKGKLGRKELELLMKALESGKGLERFNGLMEKQSASLGGMWSSFQDTVGMGLGRVLKPWMVPLKLALKRTTDAADPFFDRATEVSEKLSKKGVWAVNMITRGLRKAGPYMGEVRAGAEGFFKALRGGEGLDMVAVKDLGAASLLLVRNLPQLAEQMPSFNDGIKVAGVVTGFLADHLDTIAWAMPILAAGFLAYKAGQAAANWASLLSLPIEAAKLWMIRKQTGALALHTKALELNTGAAGLNTGATAGAAAAGAGAAGTVAGGAADVNKATGAWGRLANALGQVFLIGTLLLFAVQIGLEVAEWTNVAERAAAAGEKFGYTLAVLKIAWDAGVLNPMRMAIALAKKMPAWLVGGITGGIGSFSPAAGALAGAAIAGLQGRATGGPVNAGQPYVVGERRPEVFIPQQGGTIVPSLEDFGDLTNSLSGAFSITIPVMLDGKEITRSVVRGVQREKGRIGAGGTRG